MTFYDEISWRGGKLESSQIPLWRLLDEGHDLMFHCQHCRRNQLLELPALIRKHGPETTVEFIRRTHQCQCR